MRSVTCHCCGFGGLAPDPDYCNDVCAVHPFSLCSVSANGSLRQTPPAFSIPETCDWLHDNDPTRATIAGSNGSFQIGPAVGNTLSASSSTTKWFSIDHRATNGMFLEVTSTVAPNPSSFARSTSTFRLGQGPQPGFQVFHEGENALEPTGLNIIGGTRVTVADTVTIRIEILFGPVISNGVGDVTLFGTTYTDACFDRRSTQVVIKANGSTEFTTSVDLDYFGPACLGSARFFGSTNASWVGRPAITNETTSMTIGTL